MDRIAAGVIAPGGSQLDHPMDHQLYSCSFAAFKKKIEILAEYTMANCSLDSDTNNSSTSTHAFFGYLGYRFNKLVPYFRYDLVDNDEQSLYFKTTDISSITIGVRYEINHVAVVKFEYEYDEQENQSHYNHLYFQIAIGF